jgi:hypothetical protein
MQSISLTIKTQITIAVMVATIVLGEQGEFLIMGFLGNLTDVANALHYALQGPSKWRGRSVVKILNNLLVSIRSLDDGLEGNWVSAFIRFGMKVEKWMLLNTETCKASICIVFNSYDVSVNLTIVYDVSQVIMQAHVDTKEHTMERYPSDPAGWGMVIDLLRELATEEDVRRLSKYCSDPKYSKYLGEDDSEIFESWVAAFVGEIKYYLIRYGISGRFEGEREEEDPFRHFDGDNNNTGVEYHRATTSGMHSAAG